jgi:DNA replication protein DnaC
VIDDFGLASLNELERQDLLEAIEERYGAGATPVTSQLPLGDWHEYLGAGRIADAILDRPAHNAHRAESKTIRAVLRAIGPLRVFTRS